MHRMCTFSLRESRQKKIYNRKSIFSIISFHEWFGMIHSRKIRGCLRFDRHVSIHLGRRVHQFYDTFSFLYCGRAGVIVFVPRMRAFLPELCHTNGCFVARSLPFVIIFSLLLPYSFLIALMENQHWRKSIANLPRSLMNQKISGFCDSIWTALWMWQSICQP